MISWPVCPPIHYHMKWIRLTGPRVGAEKSEQAKSHPGTRKGT